MPVARSAKLKKSSHTPAKPEPLIETFTVDQGSSDWHDLRLGIPTASDFATIMANGRSGEESKTRKKLLYLKAAEVLSGRPMATFSNQAMARGKEVEPEAVEYYEFTRNVEVERVGFVRKTIPSEFAFGDPLIVGCSPDALVGSDGGLEVKRMQCDLVTEMIHTGRFPSEHKAQCMGGMFVTGRRWWDLVIYPDPIISTVPVFRFTRDEDYIANLKLEIERFVHDLRGIVDDVRKKGG